MNEMQRRMGSLLEAAGAAPARRLTRKVLRDDVYDELLERLISGTYPSGTSLSIEGVARELGVSPTPVREALAQLEHTGLVSRAALKGYRVAPPLSERQMAELIEARTVVELAAVERAAERAAELLPALQVAHERHEAIAKVLVGASRTPSTADMRAYFDADWEFHALIMEASDNRYLRQMLEGLGVHVHRLRQMVGLGVSDAETALLEHARVLEALSGGDAASAVAAMRDHLEGVKARAVADVGESSASSPPS